MTRPGLPTHGHHVFVPPWGDRAEVVIDGDTGHHLASVLRVRVGEAVSLADDTGTVAQAVVTAVSSARRDASMTVAIESRHRMEPPRVRLTVVQALAKGRKTDEVVQRLTEVGVDRLRPVTTSRTVKQAGDKADRLHDRWTAVALAAAQQSRRARTLVIDPVGDWPATPATGVVLWEEASTALGEAVEAVLARTGGVEEFTIAVGPEGGLSAEEVDQSGLVPCRLGQTILRTETAGIVGATLVGQALDRYA